MCRDVVKCRDYEQVRFNFTTCFFSWLCRSVKLLFANRQEVDILWKQQLDVLADIANPRWEFFLSLTSEQSAFTVLFSLLLSACFSLRWISERLCVQISLRVFTCFQISSILHGDTTHPWVGRLRRACFHGDAVRNFTPSPKCRQRAGVTYWSVWSWCIHATHRQVRGKSLQFGYVFDSTMFSFNSCPILTTHVLFFRVLVFAMGSV